MIDESGNEVSKAGKLLETTSIEELLPEESSETERGRVGPSKAMADLRPAPGNAFNDVPNSAGGNKVEITNLQFKVTATGVHQRKRIRDKDGETFKYVRICAPLKVVAETRDFRGENWGVLLEWKDFDGIVHQWSVPRDLLVRPGTTVVEQLVAGGLRVEPGKASAVKKFIDSQHPAKKIRSVATTGWHTVRVNDQDGKVFVLPNRTIGSTGDESVVLQTKAYSPSTITVSGTLESWQREVAALAVGNSRIVLSLSGAFAAPLLGPLGKESGGLHFNAVSSSGKTTTLHVASSVWGLPVERWRTTDNALETTAERHNDLLLCLDELSQLDPRKVVDTMYMIANGVGKQRSDTSGNIQPQKEWQTFFESTGELSPSDQAEIAGRNTTGGVEVRVIDLDADAGAGMGIFEYIHGANSPAAFADQLKRLSGLHCGTAGPAFVEYVVNNEEQVRRDVEKYRDEFFKKYVPALHSSGEIPRVADRFALIGAAGEVATKAGITGWKPGEAMEAAGKCFQAWLGRRSVRSSDMDKAVEQVRNAIQTYAESRFHELDEDRKFAKPGVNILNPLGYREHVDDETHFLVIPGAFQKELCKGYDFRKVAKELRERGLLVIGKTAGRYTMQHRIPGPGQAWFYVIRERILLDGDSERTMGDQGER